MATRSKLVVSKKATPKNYLSVSQASRSTPVPVTVETIRSWITRGVRGKKLLAIRVGNRRFIDAVDLRNFIAMGNGGDA